MRIVTWIMLGLGCASVWADVVVKKDGTRIQGQVVEQRITVKDAAGGTVVVPMSEVRRVELGEPARTTTPPGRSLQELVEGGKPRIDAAYERELQYALYATDASTEVLVRAARSDPRLQVRSAAIDKLTDAKHEDAHKTLVGLLDDKDPAIQLAAVQALAKRDDPRVLDALLTTLQRTQEEVLNNPLQGTNPQSRVRASRTGQAYRQQLNAYYRDKEALASTIERTIAGLRNTKDRIEKEKRRGGL